jgi:serine/threonine protein kinase
MSEGQWQRAKIIFEQAMEISKDRQADFLREACGQDPPLLARVQGMVAADAQNNLLFDQPVLHWYESHDLTIEGAMDDLTRERPANRLPFERIGNYRLIDKVGAGGMGEVYLAIEEPVGRKVAIKLLRASLDGEYLQRFTDERKALARLNQRNIVTMFATGEVDHRPYFVMEYLEGESLRDRLRRETIPRSEIVEITRQICDALNSAHQRGIVHRDIKPENIFLSHDDDGLLVKVLDFGIATLKESEMKTVSSLIVGTGPYLSPEQARGLHRTEIDGRADIYSLGLVIYEMLTGVRAFTAGDGDYAHLHLHVMPPPPSERAKDAEITVAVNGAVMKALAKAPEDRYDSVRDFARKLKDAVEGGYVLQAKLDTPPIASPKRASLPRKAFQAAMLLLLLSAAGMGVWRVVKHFNSSQDTPTAHNSLNDSSGNLAEEERAAVASDPNATSGSVRRSGSDINPTKNQSDPQPLTGTPTAASTPALPPAKPDSSSKPVLKLKLLQDGKRFVSASTVFHSGDRVRLTAAPSRSGFIYIVTKGTDGRVRILYPTPELKDSYNAVQVDQSSESPGRGFLFRFDDRPGMETLYIVFVTKKGDERLQLLEAVIKKRRNELNASDGQKIFDVLETLAGGRTTPETVIVEKMQIRHEK